MEINFISSKKDRTMRNIKTMMDSETNEVIEEIFKSLRQIYEKELEESMDGSHFTFDGINALYYDLNKKSLSRV